MIQVIKSLFKKKQVTEVVVVETPKEKPRLLVRTVYPDSRPDFNGWVKHFYSQISN